MTFDLHDIFATVSFWFNYSFNFTIFEKKRQSPLFDSLTVAKIRELKKAKEQEMSVLSDAEIQSLAAQSLEASKRSYSPYSRFPVGAALLCDDNSLYLGCNIENVSYGLSLCAERTAIVKAVSDGKMNFKAMAICSPALNEYISPCGACRQFLLEFGSNYEIVLCKRDLSYKMLKVRDLLPLNFTPEMLENSNRLPERTPTDVTLA